jgi:hypothetical protein
VSQVVPTSGSTEGTPPWFRDTIRVIHPIKSDRRLGLSKVHQCGRTHIIDFLAHKVELTP